ncbi:MAG: aldehyde ferredoxin oxidoreductase family protein, partial [Halobacteriota archaeon]|nr:aldehyde ferredoxin oxidoreductase family protein [Halobacteriota archaeon]
MNGYTGEILRINLSSGSVKTEELDMDLAEKFMGGRALSVKILYDEIEAKIDPLGPENKIIYATGPITGTNAATAGRYTVTTKSPVTGGICFPNCGGSFGPEMKYAGWDVIIIEGSSNDPVYISILDSDVEVKSAEKYMGLDTEETQDAIKKDEGSESVRVSCIGPAGEKLCKFSGIRNDYRIAARNGAGAVMGSKNLKGIAISGTGDVKVADPKGFKNACQFVREQIKHVITTTPGEGAMYMHGTGAIFDFVNMAGGIAVNNCQKGVFKKAKKVSGSKQTKELLKAKRACFGCPIACGRWIEVKEGPYAGTVGEGAEFQTLVIFGSNCGVEDINAMAKANDLCNKLGMDVISAGNTVGFAMECYEKGLITKEDTGGLELNFGNGEAMVELVKKIAYREDIGDILAEGTRIAAEKIGNGAEKFAMQVKGLETPSYDGRAAFGQALCYATSNRGAYHTDGWAAGTEFAMQPSPVFSGRVDRLSKDGKAKLVKDLQDWMGVLNSTIMCVFSGYGMTLQGYADLVATATGNSLTGEEYLKIGERSFVLERIFNAREGFGRKDD